MHELSDALARFGDEILSVRRAKGRKATTPADWAADANQIRDDFCLIHGEIIEALGAYRAGDREGFAEKSADAFMRLLGMTHGLGVDLGDVAARRLEAIRARPFQHGDKRL